MAIISKNPYTEEVIREYKELDQKEIEAKLQKAQTAFEKWRKLSIKERTKKILDLAKVLKDNKRKYGEIITKETGKAITGSIAEIEKSALNCEYVAENAEKFLSPEIIKTEAKESYISYEPLGIILEVMPWNFPFWQALRFSVPTIATGNVCILKHASNVPGSALAIEEAFIEAGFPEGIFQTFLVSASKIESILEDKRIKGVTLTGSEGAGSSVASIAGREIKKSVLELGGSDAFIVLEDADLELAVNSCTTARLNNAGQVCNSPKRALVHEKVYDKFIELLKNKFESMIVGDPMDEKTQMGTLSMESILTQLEAQIKDCVDKGGKVITGGERIGTKGYLYKPTIITGITKEMSAYAEEIFGPVSSVFKFSTIEEAIELANDTDFGLGASIWTQDINLAKSLIPELQAGAVFINKAVSSDPRLTIGGIKKSGYGRELSEIGMKEFVNIKSIWIN